jgi:hypothetical protein
MEKNLMMTEASMRPNSSTLVSLSPKWFEAFYQLLFETSFPRKFKAYFFHSFSIEPFIIWLLG